MMAYRFFLLFAFCFLYGCSAANSYYVFKPNTSVQKKIADQDKCIIASFKEIPQLIVTDYSPGYYNPGYRYCNVVNGYFYCSRFGAYSIPSYSRTYDQNSAIRQRYVASCMTKKGYVYKQLPRCSTKAESERVLKAKSIKEVTCRPKGA